MTSKVARENFHVIDHENQNKMPEATVTNPIPLYHYRIEFDNMNLRNESNSDSNHRYNACDFQILSEFIKGFKIFKSSFSLILSALYKAFL